MDKTAYNKGIDQIELGWTLYNRQHIIGSVSSRLDGILLSRSRTKTFKKMYRKVSCQSTRLDVQVEYPTKSATPIR